MPTVATPIAMAATGLVAGQNAAIVAAPSLPHNTQGVGGIEVIGITSALNVFGQWIKMFDWFNQDRLMIPVLLTLGLIIALVLWHDNLGKGFLNGCMAADTAVKNYGALKIAILAQGTDPSGSH